MSPCCAGGLKVAVAAQASVPRTSAARMKIMGKRALLMVGSSCGSDGRPSRRPADSACKPTLQGEGQMPEDPLESLREICLALPEVTERPSHGEPAWFIRGKKTFVTYANHHHD